MARAVRDACSRSLREEADLNPLGLTMAHGQIVLVLRARIRAAALWHAPSRDTRTPDPGADRHPRPDALGDDAAATAARLRRPAGATRDPRIPDPGAVGHATRRCVTAADCAPALGLAALRRLNPEIARIHPTGPRRAEEEFGLFSFSFGPAQFEAQWRVPGLHRLVGGQPTSELYREFRALLQTNGWFRGEAPDRPWILKAPQFVEDLPALLDVFPDARFICLDRDLSRSSLPRRRWSGTRCGSSPTAPTPPGSAASGCDKTLRGAGDRRSDTFRERPDVPRIDVEYEAMNRLARRNRPYLRVSRDGIAVSGAGEHGPLYRRREQPWRPRLQSGAVRARNVRLPPPAEGCALRLLLAPGRRSRYQRCQVSDHLIGAKRERLDHPRIALIAKADEIGGDDPLAGQQHELVLAAAARHKRAVQQQRVAGGNP